MQTLEKTTLATKTILLLDDETNIRELLELCLTDLGGWHVLTAESPFTGLKIAEINSPDAILLDLSMRGSFMLLKQLRKNVKTQEIPVILLSTTARWLDPQFMQEYKVAGIILKPFNPVSLTVEISAILKWNSPPCCNL
ncbi:response regulator [Tolypothrix sp. FACHB-123]|uniref:response regulator n=1 Tax=Tolypothrix sp. FACHB-123 TaxID=2692868 RepID=UPI001684193E|nr:response regulator [Tolypothrix sp. FACHB-123]MBD2358238.1 response regulator [Tolypothrix sp. FACHB-123]